MDLYFLDENFELLEDAADEFSSIVWSERYFETGTFTLHFPKSELMQMQVYDAAYVRTGIGEGHVKCGRIDYIIVSEGDCELGGHLLEALFDDRIMSGKGCFSGTLTEAVHAAVSANLRGCGVIIGSDSAQISDEVTLTYEWDTLSEWLYSVLRPFGASYKIELDPDTNTPTFKIIRGVDRSSGIGDTDSENYNTWQAVFSTSFGNIASLRFDRDFSDLKNVVYVEGSDGTVVTVDKSGNSPKREMYKLASDVKPTDFADTAEYTSALCLRGDEILANYPESVYVSAEAYAEVPPIYGVDYDLGDICDVTDDTLGLSFGMRLTSLDDVTEANTRTLYPSFGEAPNQIRRLTGTKRC